MFQEIICRLIQLKSQMPEYVENHKMKLHNLIQAIIPNQRSQLFFYQQVQMQDPRADNSSIKWIEKYIQNETVNVIPEWIKDIPDNTALSLGILSGSCIISTINPRSWYYNMFI